ncbi:PPC domain-containing DNA-binding protein [Blautia sp. MSJ-9]|uniref:PPC domain-containing DNA-binding protein n=1 Tax=Blautia sp. MSJ-9 TaxID=2841511 RepID=UPI001C102E0A|nr:PPC domain-containing DNA-binding protein [Blautia sp. MSJ-9]MBU5681572.1 DNA-binding protein [Blautia sp. MSJ-9]
MDYSRLQDTLIVRIDKGEEITSQLRKVCEKEDVKLACVEALGAVNDFTVGVFNTAEKKYHSNRFQGAFEIVSLTGTVTTKRGEFYHHLHMSAGDDKGSVYGGHLNCATVSATCEMIIRVIDGCVERRFDPEVGLNLFSFV